MPLPFSHVCELLDESYKLCLGRKSNRPAVESWFVRHRTRIDAHDTNLVALLSTLLPEKRPDRVYFIQAPTLEKIVGRGLSLGSSRKLELARHREPGSGVDLADCVERILSVTPTAVLAQNRVTVEEVDQLLHGLASRIKWSSPAVRASQAPVTQRDRGDLERIFSRLTATEAKWLTRLILKSYAPLIFDENLIFRLCDPLLPLALKIRDEFASAVDAVQSTRSRLLPNTESSVSIRKQLLATVKPQPGIKVGRQDWVQARSIKHCLDQGHGRMSVENKVDGEYCQIHIDLSKGEQCVQIFSKSGKDSTEDRVGLHGIIKDSLQIDKPGCGFSKACIIEGELAVYSDFANKILPFHKIRNHVTRRGHFLNTEQDSLPKDYEHLMIVYYDILLLDDESLLGVRHSKRSKVLSSLIKCQKGWAELVQREIVDFGHPLAASNLRNVFARTIVNKQEGLVLKPDEPYFQFPGLGRPWRGRCIKLKKEYIGNFGDVGDFAAVGAGYDAAKAKHYNIPNLKWTHFYIGCLDNRDEVRRLSARPEFTVINIVELNETQLKSVVQFGNTMSASRERNDKIKVNISPSIEMNPRLSVVFTNPLVFDLRCFSFEKGGNTGFWSLRFPMVSRVHFDRDFTDTFSFEQLQDMAKEATKAPELTDSQENLQWIARLEGADPRGIAVDTVSQQTSTTMPTPSPCRSTSSTSQRFSQSSLAAHKVAKPAAPKSYTRPSACVPDETEPPALPLTTPPTSSKAGERAPKQCPRNRIHKRDSLPSPKQSQSRKKRKSGDQIQSPSSSSQQTNMSQSRMPFAEIDGNSSQRSNIFHTNPPPSSESGLEITREMVDLTSSTDEPFGAEATEMHPPQTTSDSSQEGENISVFLPDSGRHHEHSLESPPPSQNLVFQPAGEHRPRPSGGSSRAGCVYAGPQCQFARITVLLAPHLGEGPSEMTALLESHGINNGIKEIEAWMADPNVAIEFDAVLLVDSIEHEGEMKALLTSIKEGRKTVTSERLHETITVFDWRVLKHITIMEDSSILRKYYDGFRGPWRRWYCGMV